MKVINNAKKYSLPPRYALYDAPSDVLYLYASFKGLLIGQKAAFRRGSGVEGIAVLSLVGSDWSAYPSTLLLFEGSLPAVLRALAQCGADDTKADDTKADDTKADDTKADDTKADDTKAGAVVRSYRRKVSCAGSPRSAHWAVFWRSASGDYYIRAYQSEKRAVNAYDHYISIRGACVVLLWRSPRWSWGVCRHCYNSPRSDGFTDLLMKVTRESCEAAFQHFGG